MNERDSRERIPELCRDEIASYGVRRLRVQRVAKHAGVPLGLVYHHFNGRVGRLTATVNFINEAAEGRRCHAAKDLYGIQLLEHVLLSDFDDDSETRDGLVVWNEIRAVAMFEPDMQNALSASTARWEQSLMTALAEAGVQDSERYARAMLLTAMVEGLSSGWLSGQITSSAA